MERAEKIVIEHRRAIEAIAHALLEQDVLTSAEVHAIAHAHGVRTGALGLTAA
jgi:hypothetical protein